MSAQCIPPRACRYLATLLADVRRTTVGCWFSVAAVCCVKHVSSHSTLLIAGGGARSGLHLQVRLAYVHTCSRAHDHDCCFPALHGASDAVAGPLHPSGPHTLYLPAADVQVEVGHGSRPVGHCGCTVDISNPLLRGNAFALNQLMQNSLCVCA
jgi:hypothetical protein